MRALDVTPAARADIDDLLYWSEDRFGSRTAERYRLLIQAGFASLRESPDRPGVRHDPAFPGLRLYALRHCRKAVPARDRIGRPRHVLAFRADEASVLIVRVLDGRSDLPARLAEA